MSMGPKPHPTFPGNTQPRPDWVVPGDWQHDENWNWRDDYAEFDAGEVFGRWNPIRMGVYADFIFGK